MYLTIFLIICPLCLLKDISKMRFASIFGVFSLMFLILIIIIQTPWYISDYFNRKYDPNNEKTWLNIYNIEKGFTKDFYFFKGTATLFYAYSCHVGAFPVYKSLENNTIQRTQKVFARSIMLDAAFYAIVSITGYLSNPVGTPSLIIERYKLFDNDWLMTTGWLAFIFTLIMKIPANYNSFRLTLVGLLGRKEISNKLNWCITIPTLGLSCLVAASYREISDYISLMGSFCAVVISFIIPGLLYIKANEAPLSNYKNVITIVLVSLLSLIGFTSGIMIIVEKFI